MSTTAKCQICTEKILSPAFIGAPILSPNAFTDIGSWKRNAFAISLIDRCCQLFLETNFICSNFWISVQILVNCFGQFAHSAYEYNRFSFWFEKCPKTVYTTMRRQQMSAAVQMSLQYFLATIPWPGNALKHLNWVYISPCKASLAGKFRRLLNRRLLYVLIVSVWYGSLKRFTRLSSPTLHAYTIIGNLLLASSTNISTSVLLTYLWVKTQSAF